MPNAERFAEDKLYEKSERAQKKLERALDRLDEAENSALALDATSHVKKACDVARVKAATAQVEYDAILVLLGDI